MTKEDLDSDKLNYLIWRYLVESDYRETAVRLQKEWNVEDPQQLPFAPHVTNHALVSVLNKGLLYNAAERETARANRDVQGAHTGFFGPLPLTPATSPTVHHEEDGDENVRKRQIEDELPEIQAGSAPKRPRLSNGYENGFEDSSMDVDGDQNGDGHAYPSPEQVPSPIVVPTSEQAIQLDNPIDLSNETTYLDLAEDLSSRNIVLMQCEWNPQNPDVLAAAGTDALARMWTFSRATADSESDMQLDPISPQAQDLLQDCLSPTTIVTGISWASDGSALLIATEPAEDGCARLTICSASGQHGIGHEGFESPIIRPQWNLSNTHILVLSPNDEGRGALVTVIHAIEGTATRLELPRHNLNEGYDITWTSDTDFVIVGGDTMQALRYLDGEISMFRKYETRPDHALCKVAFDTHSQLLATASETGMIDIWDSAGQCRSISAHQGLITSLAWQPLQNPLEEGAERLLASSGEDSAISIWNARSLESKPKCSMTMGQGVVGLAFTPDGSSIAGATAEFIDVWKIDNVRVPRATWTRGPELGWQSPRSNASSRDEDNHCLCWNSSGQKLAYGVNSMMAVINFPR